MKNIQTKAENQETDPRTIAKEFKKLAFEEEIEDAVERAVEMYHGPLSLIPEPEHDDLQEMAQYGVQLSLKNGYIPQLQDSDIRQEAQRKSFQKFKEENKELNPEDLTRIDLKRLSGHRLRTINDRYNLGGQEIDKINETVVKYLKGFGFPNLSKPDELTFSENDLDIVTGRYSFREDRVKLKNNYADGEYLDPVLPVLSHEFTHKDNLELLLGYENSERIRNLSKDANKLPRTLSINFSSILDDVPRVNEPIAKGLIYDKVLEETDIIVDENKNLELSVEQGRNILMPTSETTGNDEAYNNTERLVEDRLQYFPEENCYNFSKLFDGTEEEKYAYAEFLDKFEEIGEQVIQDYSLKDLDVRDEAISFFASLHIRGDEPNSQRFKNRVNDIKTHYNESEKYSENAGSQIKREIKSIFDTYNALKGTRGERFKRIMSPENRKKYLLEHNMELK